MSIEDGFFSLSLLPLPFALTPLPLHFLLDLLLDRHILRGAIVLAFPSKQLPVIPNSRLVALLTHHCRGNHYETLAY